MEDKNLVSNAEGVDAFGNEIVIGSLNEQTKTKTDKPLDEGRAEKTDKPLDEGRVVETDKSLGEGEFGKFSDARQLLNAYNALQSEFTKRCQKLKELEARVNKFEVQGADNADARGQIERALRDERFVDEVILGDARVYERAIAKYLEEINFRSQLPSLQRGGVSALTPVKRPKSLEEAKKLADSMMKG